MDPSTLLCLNRHTTTTSTHMGNLQQRDLNDATLISHSLADALYPPPLHRDKGRRGKREEKWKCERRILYFFSRAKTRKSQPVRERKRFSAQTRLWLRLLREAWKDKLQGPFAPFASIARIRKVSIYSDVLYITEFAWRTWPSQLFVIKILQFRRS